MSKINPNASSLIDEYIANKEPFAKDICELLRKLIHKTDTTIIEDWKWRIPIFHKKGIVCGFFGFKKHVSLTFFNGSQMSDKYQLFTSDCSAQNTRTIKYTIASDINEYQLLAYFKEALLLSETGVKRISNKKEIDIPELLQKELKNNKIAKENFEKMAYTYRKEYAMYISETKRDTTNIRRLEKVISNLEQNIKMHEQYKC